MLDWAFESSQEVPERKTPLLQIHGEKDRLIPIKNVQPDVVIPGGGHLFLLTHFDAVRPILQDLEKKAHPVIAYQKTIKTQPCLGPVVFSSRGGAEPRSFMVGKIESPYRR